MNRNVTYIDDLLDLDDPVQKGAFTKIANNNSIKSLPNPSSTVSHGQLIESYDNEPQIPTSQHSGQRMRPGVPPGLGMGGGGPGMNGMGGPGMGGMSAPGMRGMGGPGMGGPGMGGMRGMGGPGMGGMGGPGMGGPGMGGMSAPGMGGMRGMGGPGMGGPGMGGPGMGGPGMGGPGMGGPGRGGAEHGMRFAAGPQYGGMSPMHMSPNKENFKVRNVSKIPQYRENYKSELSCREIADHVENCPVCSKLYKQKRAAYIIAIVVLIIINLILLNRVFMS